MRVNNSKTGKELEGMQLHAAQDQTEFDRLYISSAEIIAMLGISRVALLKAYQQNRIPNPIRMYSAASTGAFWKRETIMPYLKEWYLRKYGKELTNEVNS